MQRERMARSRMSTTRLRTQTRVQFVVEVGESRARATTPSPNLNYLVVTPKWTKKLELQPTGPPSMQCDEILMAECY
jgi:hypothetical protein